MEESNPYLTAAIMEAVENQIENNDPPETRETLNRLMAQGMSREDAKLCIVPAVAIEIYNVMRNRKEFNRERFVRNLRNLPKEPTE